MKTSFSKGKGHLTLVTSFSLSETTVIFSYLKWNC